MRLHPFSVEDKYIPEYEPEECLMEAPLTLISPFSEAASLHPSGSGISHSSLLCGGPVRRYYDRRGRGHYVCAEE